MFLRSLYALLLIISYALAVRSPAHSDDALVPAISVGGVQHFEVWAGGDGGADSLSVYSGIVAALFGDVRRDGWRVRLDGGYGVYGFNRPPDQWFSGGLKDVRFRGWTGYGDILLGYQKALGPLIVKVYGGWTEETGAVRVANDSGQGGGQAPALEAENRNGRGLKGILETWLRLDDWGFLQADVSWSAPESRYSGRSRFGYRLNGSWSLGPEAAIYGSRDYDGGRLGGFVRLEGKLGEISLAAGVARDQEGWAGGYGSIAALMRF